MCTTPTQLTLLEVQTTSNSFAQSFDEQQNAQNQKRIIRESQNGLGCKGPYSPSNYKPPAMGTDTFQ